MIRESADNSEQSFPTNPQFAISVIKQRLHTLDHKLQIDPDYLQKLPRIPAITLHKPTASGGKFWTGAIMQNGVHLHWGKLKTKGNIKLITDCIHNNRFLELTQRACRKIQDGYTIHSPDTYLPK